MGRARGGEIKIDNLERKGFGAARFGIKKERGNVAWDENIVGDRKVFKEGVAYQSNGASRGRGVIVIVVNPMAGGVSREGSIIIAIQVGLLQAGNVVTVSN